MPPSLARPDNAASDAMLAPGYSRPAASQGDRWPPPLAAAAILALSVTAWFLLIQAGRVVMTLAG